MSCGNCKCANKDGFEGCPLPISSVVSCWNGMVALEPVQKTVSEVKSGLITSDFNPIDLSSKGGKKDDSGSAKKLIKTKVVFGSKENFIFAGSYVYLKPANQSYFNEVFEIDGKKFILYPVKEIVAVCEPQDMYP